MITNNNKSVLLKPINKESVVQQVIDRLTEAMLSGDLKAGDKIPTEVEMSETFGVGRNSIREAIKILVYLGVLEIRRAEGTFVRNGFTESMIDPMIYGVILSDDDSYEELKELRELMEQGMLRAAMEKSTEKDLNELYNKYKELENVMTEDEIDILKVFAVDNEFHDKIFEMAHNSLIKKINSVVRTLTYSLRLKTVTSMIESGHKIELLKAHKDIYELIKNKEYDRIDKIVNDSYFYDKI